MEDVRAVAVLVDVAREVLERLLELVTRVVTLELAVVVAVGDRVAVALGVRRRDSRDQQRRERHEGKRDVTYAAHSCGAGRVPFGERSPPLAT